MSLQKHRSRLWGILAAALMTSMLLPGQASAAKREAPADLIVTDAKVVTVDPQSRIAQALAVRDGRIIAVGDNAVIGKLAGAGTRRIDAGGRTLIPGLIDSHTHAIRAGLTYSNEVDWTTARSIPEALQRLRERAAAVGPGQWIRVSPGWAEQQFAERRLPTLAEIEDAIPDNPGWIQLRYIAVLVSSKARKELDIDEARLPPGFVVQRDAKGEATGWWTAGMQSLPTLFNKLPASTHGEALAGTRQFFSVLNRYGITGFVDHGNGDVADYAALHELWRNKELSVRVAYRIGNQGSDDVAAFERALASVPYRRGDDWVRFIGIGEGITKSMRDNPAPTRQVQDAFYDAIRWAAQKELSVSLHWIDSATVGPVLDLFERVNREVTPIAPLRWSLEHLDNISPEVMARLVSLGVGWSTHLTTYYRGDDYISARGVAAVSRQPPFVSALAAGVKVGIGTDANRAATHNPFVDLQWVLEGKSVRGTQLRTKDEIPSREQALRMLTIDAAWFGFAEKTRGSLEVGKLADFAILDRDFLSVPVEQISQTLSLLTVVDGNVVHADDSFR